MVKNKLTQKLFVDTPKTQIHDTIMEEKSGYMYPNESEYYAKVLSQIEGYPISMLDIKHDGRGVWAVSNDPEPNKEHTIFDMPRKTSGIIPREMPYKVGTYKTWKDLENETTHKYQSTIPKTTDQLIGLLGVNHFKMDKVNQDLSQYYKNGVKTLAVELPTDIQTELETYLKSSQKDDDLKALGRAWIEKSITPRSIEAAQKTLEEISGETISEEAMRAQMLDSADNPMSGNTTLKYLVDTVSNAHKLGFKVVCVDTPFNNQDPDFELGMESRNHDMANKIKDLSQNSKVVAVVGAGHLKPKNGSRTIQDFLKDAGAKYEIFNYDTSNPEKDHINKFFGDKPIKNKGLIEYMEMQ